MLTEFDPRPTSARSRPGATDWDRIRAWTDDKYMNFDARPHGRRITPSSSMYSVTIGEVVMTHFTYGIPVELDSFAVDSGNILVLTTLAGNTRHAGLRSRTELTCGQTYVVDCAHSPYRLEADAGHLQLNLTVPHRLLTDLALRWYGQAPDSRLWSRPCVVGGSGSPWLSLLDYATRTAAANPAAVATGPAGRQLEEMLVAQLLGDWARQAGIDLSESHSVPAPGYVRTAVHYIDHHARELPTVSEIAAVAGVSARALSGGFTKYLGMSPRAYLIERRLRGVRRELADGATSVASVAHAWGYVNLGSFADAYRRRFGEYPSQTLRGTPHNFSADPGQGVPIRDVDARAGG